MLAITWERPEATLWSVTLPGGTARKLRGGVVAAAVSPDGSHIALVEGKGENEIWLMDAQGEDPRRVVATDAQKGFISLAWSPDARRLAFHRYVFALDRFNAAIETVDVQTGQTRTLVEDRKLAGVPEPGLSWLPDGRRMALAVDTATESNAWLVERH
jgi:Tol biopolymer transport system component